MARFEVAIVRYCLNLPAAGPSGDARTLSALAALAEESGWDAVLLEDYLVYQNRAELPAYDPWVALAAMALCTRTLRLGVMVTPLARRRPWKLAKEAVTLDHLSGGRLIIGAGLGDSTDMSFTRFGEGISARVRAEMLDESLAILDGLWRGEPFSYTGRHYTVDSVTCLPKPVQQPRIPIWIGGAYPNRGPLRRAARWDGACLYKAAAPGGAEDSGEGLDADDVRALKAFVGEHRAGDSPFDVVVGRTQRADTTAERTHIRSLAEAGATWWQEWIPPSEPAVMRAGIARGPLRID
jgi:alkanesulfonate monooxygenase SsuD/methylene tetrahydromethanopterin reductase-like flavin-dependent oxidoreductase (luciferase family)